MWWMMHLLSNQSDFYKPEVNLGSRLLSSYSDKNLRLLEQRGSRLGRRSSWTKDIRGTSSCPRGSLWLYDCYELHIGIQTILRSSVLPLHAYEHSSRCNFSLFKTQKHCEWECTQLTVHQNYFIWSHRSAFTLALLSSVRGRRLWTGSVGILASCHRWSHHPNT